MRGIAGFYRRGLLDRARTRDRCTPKRALNEAILADDAISRAIAEERRFTASLATNALLNAATAGADVI